MISFLCFSPFLWPPAVLFSFAFVCLKNCVSPPACVTTRSRTTGSSPFHFPGQAILLITYQAKPFCLSFRSSHFTYQNDHMGFTWVMAPFYLGHFISDTYRPIFTTHAFHLPHQAAEAQRRAEREALEVQLAQQEPRSHGAPGIACGDPILGWMNIPVCQLF